MGLPATTGSQQGLDWLQNFNTSCKGACEADFIATHFYGDFGGLASWLGQIRAAYPALDIWVTEYADPDVKLKDSQSFYNESSDYFDRLE